MRQTFCRNNPLMAFRHGAILLCIMGLLQLRNSTFDMMHRQATSIPNPDQTSASPTSTGQVHLLDHLFVHRTSIRYDYRIVTAEEAGLSPPASPDTATADCWAAGRIPVASDTMELGEEERGTWGTRVEDVARLGLGEGASLGGVG